MKCLRGASAVDDVLKKFDAKKIRVFTVWEKVMKTDGEPPIAATLARVSHPGALQFWDPNRTVSKQSYGEIDDDSIAWDCLFIYPPYTHWDTDLAPAHNFTTRPVVDNRDKFEQAISAAMR